jgi:hypothetical protein
MSHLIIAKPNKMLSLTKFDYLMDADMLILKKRIILRMKTKDYLAKERRSVDVLSKEN